MVHEVRRGSEFVVVKAELGKEEKNRRRETGTLSWLKTTLALPRRSMPM